MTAFGHIDEDGAAGLAGDFTGFEGDGARAPGEDFLD
jgi:hypothetical protein